MTRDDDTSPENLTYYIQHLSGGYLSYKNFFNRKIHNFTQDDINREHIFFINDYNGQNGQLGQVVFYVSDGVHNTRFVIDFVIEYVHILIVVLKRAYTSCEKHRCDAGNGEKRVFTRFSFDSEANTPRTTTICVLRS